MRELMERPRTSSSISLRINKDSVASANWMRSARGQGKQSPAPPVYIQENLTGNLVTKTGQRRVELGNAGRLQRIGDPSEATVSRLQGVIESRLLFSTLPFISD